MKQPTPTIQGLPYALYRAEQVRELDRVAIEEFGIPGLTLMERAGEAAFALLRERWPECRHITLLCGVGNNAGDAFVVGRLALQAGFQVEALQLGDEQRLKGDALTNARAFREAGGDCRSYQGLPRKTDLFVDGLFGTGLQREVAGAWRSAIEAVNSHPAPVLALDIPSGLSADSGRVLGTAIKAQASVTFIGLKQGMFTGEGPACCGEIHFDALRVPAAVYSRVILAARRVDWQQQSNQLSPRDRGAHKGDFGHLLVVGGNRGFGGAARLAAEAAARAGAGLVSVATHPAHGETLCSSRPELMCQGIEPGGSLSGLLKRASVVAIGPGLGQDDWALKLFGQVLESGLPLVVDADGLNLLAREPLRREQWVLTPHPGEAARMLGCSTAEIAADRFQAAAELQQKFGGNVLLKGAGSILSCAGDKPPGVCSEGNPGMASGGMGDLLTGVIGALMAQGWQGEQALSMGCAVHGAAAGIAAEAGERGMLASDLLPHIRRLLNPEIVRC